MIRQKADLVLALSKAQVPAPNLHSHGIMSFHSGPVPMRIVLLSLLPSLLCAQLPPEPAHIQLFQSTAPAVRRGGTVTLRWSVTGTERVRLEPLGQDLPARGEITQPVNGRTIFWLHASNLRGGQSIPLVVELLPDDQAFPNLNGLPPQPAVAAPVPAAPALVPVPIPVLAAQPPKRRHARRAWIQFAAMVSPNYIDKLQKKLLRVAATEARLVAKARRSGLPMQFIRSGPFPSVQAARRRLRELAPALAAMRLRPIIVTGPGRAETPGLYEMASVRN
jgi:hypothetical protein